MTLHKRLKSLWLSAITALALVASPQAYAAGTVPLALSVQTDSAGNIAAGCILYFFVAGTVGTPQNSYSDFGLSQNPLTQVSCDQSGRLPMFWLADGLIHIRLTDSGGIVIVDTTMQVLGPSSGGGGGGGTVDPTTILSTGDLKFKYATGGLSGFVRLNGLTIGSGLCGCSERANADTQNLFVYLYTMDPNLAVSGGRTGNALNDFNANKQLTLPDMRGRVVAGLDDMGNSLAGRLTSTYFGSAATVLGVANGSESETLTLPQLPSGITSGGTFASTATNFVDATNDAIQFSAAGGSTAGVWWAWSSGATIGRAQVTGAASVTSNNTNGNPHAIVQPTMLATFYIKL